MQNLVLKLKKNAAAIQAKVKKNNFITATETNRKEHFPS